MRASQRESTHKPMNAQQEEHGPHTHLLRRGDQTTHARCVIMEPTHAGAASPHHGQAGGKPAARSPQPACAQGGTNAGRGGGSGGGPGASKAPHPRKRAPEAREQLCPRVPPPNGRGHWAGRCAPAMVRWGASGTSIGGGGGGAGFGTSSRWPAKLGQYDGAASSQPLWSKKEKPQRAQSIATSVTNS